MSDTTSSNFNLEIIGTIFFIFSIKFLFFALIISSCTPLLMITVGRGGCEEKNK